MNDKGSKEPFENEQYVYFMQGVDTGRIKIGISTNPLARMRGLQLSEKVILLHVMEGGQTLEVELHRRFAYLRHHGEWFDPGGEIFEYIENAGISEIEIYKE